jgi:hypothetical protein
MGLRCLIGHDFGEMQTDRDRRERGDEVIVTITEYRECERCGHARVVSENKEVRSTAATEQAAPDEGEDAPAELEERTESLDDVTAEEDDGVILEDEVPGRQHGEWPEDRSAEADAGEDGASEPTPWPEVEGEDEGYAAEPSDGGLEGVEFSSGLRPEAAATDAGGGTSTEDGDVIEASGDGSRGGFRRARPSPTGRRRRSETPGRGVRSGPADQRRQSRRASDTPIVLSSYVPDE